MITAIKVSPETETKRWLSDLIPGLIGGLFIVINCISFAALIFSGNLASYLPMGIGLMLLTGIIINFIGGSFSSFPSSVFSPQDSITAILAFMATNIVAVAPPTMSTRDQFLTIIAAIIVTSGIRSLIIFGLGWFNLGKFIRFIPYPVIGGFMAGSGWLLFRGSLKLMTGISLDLTKLPEQIATLLTPDLLMKWIPGLIFALILTYVLPRFRQFWVMPCLLTAAFIIFYLILNAIGISQDKASEMGLLLGPFNQNSSLEFLSFKALTEANWPLIFTQTTTMAALCLINVIGLLLNASAIELVTEKDVDLNQELKVSGVATLISALFGGFGGFQATSISSLAHRLGGKTRLVGWIVSSVCLTMLLIGPSILSTVPKALVGGLLLYLGLDFLIEWVYQAWFKLSRADYFIVQLILLIVAAIGYLQGVAIGTVAAMILFTINCSQLNVTKHILSGKTYHSNVLRTPKQEQLLRHQGDEIYIVELEGLLFFGTASKLLNNIRERIDNPNLQALQYIILSFRLCKGLDGSAVLSFVKLQQIARQKRIVIAFANLTLKQKQKLQQGGCLLDQDEFCLSFSDLDLALEWCEQEILDQYTQEFPILTLAEQLEPLFDSKEFVQDLMKYLTPVQLATGEYLFHQGDPFDGLYFVEKGRVSIILELADGNMKRIRSYTGGNTIGEIGLYRQAPRTASVIADEPTSLYFLSSESFKLMEINQPFVAGNFHRFIVNMLTERLIHREQELKSLLW